MSEQKLTTERAFAEFKKAYQAKRKLVDRQLEDFRFALGEQWDKDDAKRLKAAGIKPCVDNRIQPNIFLITGLERQNRADFKAFPEGEEDGLKADIASALFKDAIKKSGFGYKSSEQFKDGITCGESHLELYLDYTESLINGKPCWAKADGGTIIQDPASREYDFSDARYVYKVKLGMEQDDLINLYPKKRRAIRRAGKGKLDMESMLGATEHNQPRDYAKPGDSGRISDDELQEEGFDLIERYYKKWVEKVFVGDQKTGELKEAESLDSAEVFVEQYQAQIVADAQAYEAAVGQAVAQAAMQVPGMPVQMTEAGPAPMIDTTMAAEMRSMMDQNGQLPPAPPQQDPERFIVIRRMVPEMWCFAFVPGIDEPLSDARAWFYPKWKGYPFVPYFARFSTAPLQGDERHLLVQGVVHGVKGVQEKHNKAEVLLLRHLNTTANSGWLTQESSWVDPAKVEQLGTQAGVNLEYRKDSPKPDRITPVPLSQGHAQISESSIEAIKGGTGINSDLVAAQQGGGDSGRAIALRQKQGLLMMQELFDNLTRSKQIAGRFLLSQLGEIYDTESAMKVLGEAFLQKSFPAPTLLNEQNGEPEPMVDEATGQPMRYDKAMAEVAIAEVLSGDLWEYDVSVGEAVASETIRMAIGAEIAELQQ